MIKNPEIDPIIIKAQQACNSLITLLEQENRALITGENLELGDISAMKLEQLAILNKYQTELNALFSNLSTTKPDAHAPVNKSNQQFSKLTVNKWVYFLDSLEQCRRLNNKNGYIINTSLRNTQTSLAILRGQDQNEMSTYTNNGHNVQKIASRTIAKI